MAAESTVPQLVDKKGGSYAAIAPKLEPGKFNNWKKLMLCYLAGIEPYYLKCIKDGLFQPKTAEGAIKPECNGPKIRGGAKSSKSLSQTYTCYKTLLNELANDGVNLSKHKINVGFVNSLPEKWLTFSQELRNNNHTQTFDLVDIYGRFVYEDNLIQKENSDDEIDERTSEEYLRDLDIKFYERALLENSKREKPGLCIMKHTNPKTQESSSKSVSGAVTDEVMAISVISISSDSSEDSVGTPIGREILFGTISTTIPDTTPVVTPLTTQTDTPVIPTETPIIAPTIPPSPDYTPAAPPDYHLH
ncbi:hypothetical protein Tco_0360936 [Tanacetum coccineum]